jgi:hypothetical protein
MNQTTQAILQELAQTGHAVIINSRARDLHAATDLISAGICHRANTFPDYFIIKFGRAPITI